MPDAPSFRARLSWDAVPGEIRDGAVRYMMIRPDALMAVFAALAPERRKEALAAFHQAVATYGARSASAYNAAASRPLIHVVAATAPDLGWGVWSVEDAPHGYTVSVANSPFAAGIGNAPEAVCTPITGMLSAVGGIMANRPAHARETRCAARDGHGPCHFELTTTGDQT